MIDLDEAGIKPETVNCCYQKKSLLERMRERENNGHDVNHTLKMAISGNSNGIARQWIRFDTGCIDIYFSLPLSEIFLML